MALLKLIFISLLFWVPLLLLTPVLAGLEPLDCADLEKWVLRFDPLKTKQIAPKIAMPAATLDDAFEQLFGKSILVWNREDFRSFDQQLKACQKATFKRDRSAAKKMNRARKAVNRIQRSVSKMTKATDLANTAVDNMLTQPQSKKMLEVLGLAKSALKGEDVLADVKAQPQKSKHGLQQLVSARPNLPVTESELLVARLTEQYEIAQTAVTADTQSAQSELKAALAELDNVPASEAGLAELDRLAQLPALSKVPPQEADIFRRAVQERREAVQLAVASEQLAEEAKDREAALAELEAAKTELSNVPVSREGLHTLDRLAKHPVLAKVQPAKAKAFQTAVQQKRWAIQRTLQQQESQKTVARAAQPIDVATRLEKMLFGGSLENLSIRNLHPGMPYDQAKAVLEQNWKYKSGLGIDPSKKFFGVTRSDMANYTKIDRRDGGMVEIATIEGKVGQIKFTEHYTGPLDANAARAWLVEHFGQPDKEQTAAIGRMMAWRNNSTRLQVKVANQVEEPSRKHNYKSTITFALWSRTYQELTAKTKKRCDELSNIPMNQLSLAQRQELVMCMF